VAGAFSDMAHAMTYMKNSWLIPRKPRMHDMEELSGKEGLLAMPPFQELSP
jgi:hypothetical protein